MMEAFTRILIALLAAATAVSPALAEPANPFVQRLQAMGDLQRRAVLRGALVNSGQRCGRAEIAVAGGRYRNLTMWSVRCAPGGDYGLFVGPDGSAQVRTCADLAKLALPRCRLPAPRAAKAAAPPALTPRPPTRRSQRGT